jgi:hypothetical protein
MLLSNQIQKIVSIATSATLIFAIAPNANAQRILSPAQTQQVINGLSYPTSSQRFFEAGQRNFEREIARFREGEFPPPKSILQIDEKLLRQGEISPRDRFKQLSVTLTGSAVALRRKPSRPRCLTSYQLPNYCSVCTTR